VTDVERKKKKRTEAGFYAACDLAIRAMDRENLEAFGRLKMTDWEKANLIQAVMAVYLEMIKRARRRYYEVGFEAYVLGCLLSGEEAIEAHRMAEKAIDMEWVDAILDDTDFVTTYRFREEAERKAHRLAETLEVVPDRNAAIDRALKMWVKQLGQYAINVTDYAVVQAYEDCGVKRVMWVTERDNRVCTECHQLDGKVFAIDEVPRKPHMNCRCRVVPVRDE
jgi:SPP1 gp7 family putative phage head morphogenesis protein